MRGGGPRYLFVAYQSSVDLLQLDRGYRRRQDIRPERAQERYPHPVSNVPVGTPWPLFIPGSP